MKNKIFITITNVFIRAMLVGRNTLPSNWKAKLAIVYNFLLTLIFSAVPAKLYLKWTNGGVTNSKPISVLIAVGLTFIIFYLVGFKEISFNSINYKSIVKDNNKLKGITSLIFILVLPVVCLFLMILIGKLI